MDIRDKLEKIRQFIYDENKNYSAASIPEADYIIRRQSQFLTEPPERVSTMLTVLVKANMIEAIPVVQSDNELFLEETTGYVVTMPDIINHLKFAYERELQNYYNKKFEKIKLAPEITKELMPRIASYNNTMFGKLILACHHLRVLQKAIGDNEGNYSTSYTSNLLKQEILREFNEGAGLDDLDSEAPESAPAQAAEAPRRAVDDPRYQEFEKAGDSNWNKATTEFGVNFLLRIHFRKNEFSVVKKLVTNGQVTKLPDLKNILSMLRTIEKNMSLSGEFKKYEREIVSLRTLTYNVIKRKYPKA